MTHNRQQGIRDPFLRLAQTAIRRPWPCLLVPLLVVALAVPGLLRLQLRTDGGALIPHGDPAIETDSLVRERFGLVDPILVTLTSDHPDGIYNAETLRVVATLSEALAADPAIDPDRVLSLATERRDRVYTGTLDFRPFLDPFPDSAELMAVLRADVEAVDLLAGTLVSRDHVATVISVGLVPGQHHDRDRTALYRRIDALVDPFRTTLRIDVVGAPAAETLLGVTILKDLSLILPFCIATIALLLLLGCRSFWGMALGLAEVGGCLVFTFGLMGWLGVPVYLTTAVLPMILATVGLADEIHLFWRYQQLVASGEVNPVRTLMSELVRPVTLTSLTTSIGFLSFLSSPLPAVRAFGIFAPLGILFCLFWSLTLIPAALTLLGRRRMGQARSTRQSDWSMRLFAPALRRPRATLVLLSLVVIVLGAGTTRLFVQDSWLDGFGPQSAFRRATDHVNKAFNGTHLLQLHLAFEPLAAPLEKLGDTPSGPLLVPENLALIGELEAWLRDRTEVGGVLGPHAQLSTTNFLWRARREHWRLIPDNPPQIATLLRRFEDVRGTARRRELIDDSNRECVVTVFMKNANYRDTATLMGAIRDYGGEHLGAVRLSFAGDVAVSQAMIPIIVRSQVLSLLLALGGALLAVSLLYRSLRIGLMVLAPTSAAVLAIFGLMGWLAIPLGVATSMFCAITLGIGVDYAIHFHAAYRATRAEHDSAPTAVAQAVARVGPAILVDTVAISIGFGLLMLSQVPANARLGMLVACALIANSLFTLAGLGAFLARLPKK